VRVQYLGSETVIYPDYVDNDTGAALTCTIGGVYDITPAEIPDGRFASLEPLKQIEPPKGTAAPEEK